MGERRLEQGIRERVRESVAEASSQPRPMPHMSGLDSPDLALCVKTKDWRCFPVPALLNRTLSLPVLFSVALHIQLKRQT